MKEKYKKQNIRIYFRGRYDEGNTEIENINDALIIKKFNILMNNVHNS